MGPVFGIVETRDPTPFSFVAVVILSGPSSSTTTVLSFSQGLSSLLSPFNHHGSRQSSAVTLFAVTGSVVGVNISLRYLAVSFNQTVGATTPFFTAVFAHLCLLSMSSPMRSSSPPPPGSRSPTYEEIMKMPTVCCVRAVPGKPIFEPK
ncbi:hypothetical protein PIB30_048916 [Stylosanthes scabra]|uniref:Uncharacterized protein n=1 Tax=Stylosanthes scabra TaxID=79078 RepID=A0ABU6VIS0_9FABA|nr:hypothetical protein [Stylosanthes scabra]